MRREREGLQRRTYPTFTSGGDLIDTVLYLLHRCQAHSMAGIDAEVFVGSWLHRCLGSFEHQWVVHGTFGLAATLDPL